VTRIEPNATAPKQPDKSLGDLFGELSHEFTELVQTQVELAKTEIRAQADTAKRTAGAFAGAGVAGYMALILLSFAAAWGLSEVVPEGVAFLIVGAVFAVIAAVLFMRARAQAKELNIVPKQTVDSLKEDVEWARQNVS
jgi:uncharacterized membrane protein YqjE